jgi:hypothetical protein
MSGSFFLAVVARRGNGELILGWFGFLLREFEKFRRGGIPGFCSDGFLGKQVAQLHAPTARTHLFDQVRVVLFECFGMDAQELGRLFDREVTLQLKGCKRGQRVWHWGDLPVACSPPKIPLQTCTK